MIIIMKATATTTDITDLKDRLESRGLRAVVMQGQEKTAVGVIGETRLHLPADQILALPSVESIRRVSDPCKLANRLFHPEDTIVKAGSAKVGGGHFAKMVHNGIEYGMMQAFGEGFATMVKSDLVEDPAAVMSSWRNGSVVQSWLLDLLAIAFKSDPTLKSMPPVANESGEAKWMIEAALELGVPTPATAAALYARQTSRGGADDILRVVSTMRAQFGGHVTKIDEIATH